MTHTAFLAGACTAFAALAQTGPPAAVSGQTAAMLSQIAGAGQLSDLRWPDFSDYRLHVQNFYQPAGYALAWVHGGQPSPQALGMIAVLQQAANKGLDAEDYDGSRWAARVAHLPAASEAEQAQFDAALTVCTMRYISDLHIGKLNPKYFHFGLDVEHKKYSLPDFLRQRVVDAPDPRTVLETVEPPFPGYQRIQAALVRYLDLARQDGGEPLPVPAKTLVPGSPYPGVPRLTTLLRLVGDLPQDATADANTYTGPLVDAVKRFQRRHGLQPDGRLDAQTLKSLNTPLSFRVRQMQLTLERWRWLPHDFDEPPIIVNVPEFHLRAYSTNQEGPVALEMNVIVGKAYGHKTPIFAENMQYAVLRPYWNVPPSIQRSEIVPAIQKDRDYIAKKGFEVTTHAGEVVTSGAISDDVLARLRAGTLEVRQKPGPSNSLGLVKLIFPNNYNVYLHSTPAPELFSRSRRDFSHGCIRLEKPDEMTAWVLRNNPGWNLERVREAMKSGKDNQRVNLVKPIPVLILYGTAIVDEAGAAYFLDDIYGLDADLEKVLAKGYPYPG
ncbi:MAG TPA: L,D-transpeptidase family protein [Bryobacteraceae bacterium]|nr:L,D-transpeptidase family protein [Bryobacteraceae bacterium]